MNPTRFISIQGSYKQLELSLFDNNTCLQTIKDKNLKASSLLIPYLEKILAKNRLNFFDIKFICTDQGPGAFTSLRVTVSTINGLAFANQIPAVGIDGLDALSLETITLRQPVRRSFSEIGGFHRRQGYGGQVGSQVNKFCTNSKQIS